MVKCSVFTLLLFGYLNNFGIGFSNQIFKSDVHTVLLKNEKSFGNEPIIILNSEQQLTLRFDCFDKKVKNFTYTLIHCNPDWSPSDLYANEYLDGFMEENIRTYTFSQNTTQPYIHYYCSFPSSSMKITKSGNYALLVYEDFDKNNVVLTQKFFVADNQVSIIPLPSQTLDNQVQYTHHQINFKVNQNLINSTNPRREFNVVMMQNLNFANQKFNLMPAFINGKILSFDGRKMDFPAGNEFRKFDLRNINQNINGVGVYKIMYEAPNYHVILAPCESRGKSNFSTISDFNGERYIKAQNLKSEFSETDYAWVYFYLNSEDSTNSVYIWGELSNWEKIPEAKMTYNAQSKQYVGKLFLKQGIYDFSFLKEYPETTTPENKLSWDEYEGNFYQTENNYYIFVYYQNFSKNYFELVGVKKFKYR